MKSAMQVLAIVLATDKYKYYKMWSFLLTSVYRTNFKYNKDVDITDATEEPPMCPQKLTYMFPPDSHETKHYENITYG